MKTTLILIEKSLIEINNNAIVIKDLSFGMKRALSLPKDEYQLKREKKGLSDKNTGTRNF